MKVAILHHHLNRSGVTRVIRNHLLALDSVARSAERLEVLLLYDGQATGWPPDLAAQLSSIHLTLCAIPRLRYDSSPVAEPGRLAGELKQQLRQSGFLTDETVLHVHNHSLGKNASLPGALTILANQGMALLLQTHDFAEDFRPRNYRHLAQSLDHVDLALTLYPQASQIHYAVLNRRDEDVLLQAGVPGERLHWLPNPVAALDHLPDRDLARKKLDTVCGVGRETPYLVYPVRGIRRKNLGEVLLWAALVKNDTQFGVTLAPLNPKEQPIYENWKRVAQELQLPLHFEMGAANRLAFEENLTAADRILTTSVAEGFGMVFLESWLAGRSLLGRNLPEITADFTEAGVNLEQLYSLLRVPLDWMDFDSYRATVTAAYRKVVESYGRALPSEAILDHTFDRRRRDGYVDFGSLDESLQEEVIRRVRDDRGAWQVLHDLNPTVSGLALASDCELDSTIKHNRNVIQDQYALPSSGQRLFALYENVLASQRDARTDRLPHGENILDRFLDFSLFRLIRT